MKEVLYGDSKQSYGSSSYGERASGRFGIARGYDGIMANESYEPDRMFILYNRSKVMIQQDSLDYNVGKTQGAA
jgi:hypothetical protein